MGLSWEQRHLFSFPLIFVNTCSFFKYFVYPLTASLRDCYFEYLGSDWYESASSILFTFSFCKQWNVAIKNLFFQYHSYEKANMLLHRISPLYLFLHKAVCGSHKIECFTVCIKSWLYIISGKVKYIIHLCMWKALQSHQHFVQTSFIKICKDRRGKNPKPLFFSSYKNPWSYQYPCRSGLQIYNGRQLCVLQEWTTGIDHFNVRSVRSAALLMQYWNAVPGNRSGYEEGKKKKKKWERLETPDL